MHEYGLAEGVLATVRQRAGGRKVAGIKVRFGVRHAVDSESLSQAFGFVAAGTEAADATVDLVTVPATVTCRTCGAAAETSDVLAVCPRCGGADVEISGGDEMTLESITYQPVAAGERRLCAWGSRPGLWPVTPVIPTWSWRRWAVSPVPSTWACSTSGPGPATGYLCTWGSRSRP